MNDAAIDPAGQIKGTSSARDAGAVPARGLGWFGVIRLGLVQTALGAIVVLTTSVINRVMVVELALPALLPGLLVGLHFGVQFTRPHMGHGSDRGRRRTPWIIGGLAVLALGAVLAAVGTALVPVQLWLGIGVTVLAFTLVGLGVAAAGTSLLVLLAATVTPRYRGSAATTVWIMMIVGFIVTTLVAGSALEPYSHLRLIQVSLAVSVIALIVATLAVAGIERRFAPPRGTTGASASHGAPANAAPERFRDALSSVWAEPAARRFAVFVFVSMLAYSAQDLVLEPFAGAVHGFSVGESTRLSSSHHQGVLLGLLIVALMTALCAGSTGRPGAPPSRLRLALGSLRSWTLIGCCLSACALALLVLSAFRPALLPLVPEVLLLGIGNGLFAAGAIGSMMDLVGQGGAGREGVRMGLWGAAQAIAFGLGGIAATGLVDIGRLLSGDVRLAYALVFTAQLALFLFAAQLARGVYRPARPERRLPFDYRRAALDLNG